MRGKEENVISCRQIKKKNFEMSVEGFEMHSFHFFSNIKFLYSISDDFMNFFHLQEL